MQKVSMWAAVKKTWLLLNARSGYYAKFAMGLLAVNGLYVFLQLMSDVPEGEFRMDVAFVGLVYFIASYLVSISLQHFTVLSCRNQTSFFPQQPVMIFYRYLLATIAIGALALIAAVVFGLPLMGVVFSGILDNPDYGVLGSVLAVFAILIVGIGGMVPIVRFAVIYPAITVNDNWNYSKAWRMTKGHTGRMVAMAWVFSILSVVVDLIWGVMVGLNNPDVLLEPSVAYLIVSSIYRAALGVCLNAFLGVVYEDFKNRDEAMSGIGA
jgi:hypothetical protein